MYNKDRFHAPSHCGPSNHCSKAAASRTRGVSTRWGTRSPIARSRGKTWHVWPALSHAGPARPTRAPGGRRLKGKDIGVLVEDTLEAHMYCTPRVHLVYTSCTSAREHRSKWNTEQVTSTKRESVILFAFAVQLSFNETQKERTKNKVVPLKGDRRSYLLSTRNNVPNTCSWLRPKGPNWPFVTVSLPVVRW